VVLYPHELRAFGVSSRGPRFIKPDREGLTRAAQLLRGGGVVAFPTDTVYGLGADASDELAQRRIYQIKGRPVGMPLILMAAAESQLTGWVHVDSRAEEIIRRWWPGPLTVILHALGGGTLGVRIPNHEVALELLRASGPLMTTSANLHGKDPAMTAGEAGELPDLAAILDGGPAPGGTASTVLDLTGPEPHILREGAIPGGHLLGLPPPRAG
jgi:L-threonylcarbamoyladenylate synthase